MTDREKVLEEALRAWKTWLGHFDHCEDCRVVALWCPEWYRLQDAAIAATDAALAPPGPASGVEPCPLCDATGYLSTAVAPEPFKAVCGACGEGRHKDCSGWCNECWCEDGGLSKPRPSSASPEVQPAPTATLQEQPMHCTRCGRPRWGLNSWTMCACGTEAQPAWDEDTGPKLTGTFACPVCGRSEPHSEYVHPGVPSPWPNTPQPEETDDDVKAKGYGRKSEVEIKCLSKWDTATCVYEQQHRGAHGGTGEDGRRRTWTDKEAAAARSPRLELSDAVLDGMIADLDDPDMPHTISVRQVEEAIEKVRRASPGDASPSETLDALLAALGLSRREDTE